MDSLESLKYRAKSFGYGVMMSGAKEAFSESYSPKVIPPQTLLQRTWSKLVG